MNMQQVLAGNHVLIWQCLYRRLYVLKVGCTQKGMRTYLKHPIREFGCVLLMHSDRCCDCRLGSERGGSKGAGGATSTSLSNRTEADVACMLFAGDTQPRTNANARR